jgi:hypothetical protein
VKTVSTAVTAVPASIAKNVDTAIDGLTRAFVNKELRQERECSILDSWINLRIQQSYIFACGDTN